MLRASRSIFKRAVSLCSRSMGASASHVRATVAASASCARRPTPRATAAQSTTSSWSKQGVWRACHSSDLWFPFVSFAGRRKSAAPARNRQPTAPKRTCAASLSNSRSSSAIPKRIIDPDQFSWRGEIGPVPSLVQTGIDGGLASRQQDDGREARTAGHKRLRNHGFFFLINSPCAQSLARRLLQRAPAPRGRMHRPETPARVKR